MAIKIEVERDYGKVQLNLIFTPSASELRIKKTSDQKIYCKQGIIPKVINNGGVRELAIFPIEAEYALLVEKPGYEYSLFIKAGGKQDYIYLGDEELEIIANSYRRDRRKENIQNGINKIAKEMNVPETVSLALNGKKGDIGNFLATVQNALKKYSKDTTKITALERATTDNKIARILLKNMGIYIAKSTNPSILARYVLEGFNKK